MGIIDITGEIREGLWNYGEPYPDFKLKHLPQPEWVENKVYCDIFDGMHSQSGTYLETPAHMLGNCSYMLDTIPLEKLIDIKCVVLQVKCEINENRPAITADMLKGISIPQNCALLISTGWGVNWANKNYLSNAPYFTYDAMKSLIEKKPFILGSDSPRWDNLEHPQNFFNEFYRADILMLAPLVNLDRINYSDCLLTVLPMKVMETCCAPCRAYVKEAQLS